MISTTPYEPRAITKQTGNKQLYNSLLNIRHYKLLHYFVGTIGARKCFRLGFKYKAHTQNIAHSLV